ncbi:HAD family hydrolase [Noviherbaspirillum galbum]|uniref:HAD hydrolase-like protein n=1 Tax=Noviherbaspirillum galbum TaxID=2709383 RepID=A0A6B3SX33_9BURK|nr:HAD family hydrolase [Noviherbaspirillum galbum]NEX64075.1 HAD hydrolase-like protein [Noviherbaspirillum galbum]
MGIELLAFGLDGVVFDTESAHLHACRAAFGEAGLELDWDTRQFREAARVRGAAHALNTAIDALPSEGMANKSARQLVSSLTEARTRHFLATIRAEAPVVQPGFSRLMEDALSSGCKLAIVTDLPAQAVTTLLERGFGNAFDQLFSVIVSGADFEAGGGRSPHDLALRTTGVEAHRGVAIHNAAPALRAAQLAGIWTVAVTPYDKEVACISGANLWCPQLQELQELRELADPRRALRESASPRRFVDFGTLSALRRSRVAHKPGQGTIA